MCTALGTKDTRLKQLFHRTKGSGINCSSLRIIPESKLQGSGKVLSAHLEPGSPQGGVKETKLLLEAVQVDIDGTRGGSAGLGVRRFAGAGG